MTDLDYVTDTETNILYGKESYQIIGICMEVHSQLGKGFSEVVYKDALEFEFNRADVSLEREKKFTVRYKSVILPSRYVCDFVIMGKIVLEIKAQSALAPENAKQVLNYLAVTRLRLGLLVNFGEDNLVFKRVIL